MSRFRVPDTTLAAMLSDGAVLLNLHSKRYFSLNETGSRIWELLGLATPAEEIPGMLVLEYDVSAAQAEQEVAALLDVLVAERLIEPVA